jgi:uncharacterized protein (TIGR01244 family)
MRHVVIKVIPALLVGLLSGVVAAAARVDVPIDDTGVFPESITSTRAGDLITGSVKGIIYRARPGEPAATAWIRPDEANGLGTVFGVLAHEPSGTLWVCSAPTFGAPPKPGAVNALVSFDLARGALRARYPFPPGPAACNDIAVAPDGAVYVSDTQGARILRLAPQGRALEVFAEDERLRGVDGIAFSGDGKLYVNNVQTGAMLRVAIGAQGKVGALTPLKVSQPLGGPDGLRLIEGNRFLQAEGTAGRITEVTIDGDQATVRVLREGLDSSPGVTRVGDTVYAIEGKIRYLIDPKLRGQDPGPFRILAIPLSGGALPASLLTGLPRHIELSPLLHVSGQPSGDQLALLPSAGIRSVIDLRPDAERPDFDERMVAVHLGLDYHPLPIRDAQDLTRANVESFDQLLERTQRDGVLVHCASGNRVGAMMALRARWLQGKEAAEALAIGKASGLTSLEADVQKLLGNPVPPAILLPKSTR